MGDPGGFDIREQIVAGYVCIVLNGELDLSTAPVLQDRLRQLAIDRNDAQLDLSTLEFIDLAGARVIEDALHSAQREGRRLWVRPERSPPVARLCGLLQDLSREASTISRAQVG